MNLHSHFYTQFDQDPTPIVDFMKWVAESYRLPKKTRVLDIGCGPGRMLTEYHGLGWKVSALEPDADFHAAATQLTAADSGIRVEHGGFLELDAVNQYDLITAINDPFSYLLAVDDRVEALGRMYRALRPGGVMFLELTNFLYKLWEYEDYTSEESIVDGKRVVHNMHHEVDFFHGRWVHHDEYIIEGQPNPILKTHTLAIFPLPELLYFLDQHGFTDIRTFSSYEARQSEKPNGKTILITARKPLQARMPIAVNMPDIESMPARVPVTIIAADNDALPPSGNPLPRPLNAKES